MSRRTAVDFRGVACQKAHPQHGSMGGEAGQVPFPHRTGIVVRRSRVGRNSHGARCD